MYKRIVAINALKNPFEWTSPQQLSATHLQAFCLPLKGSVTKIRTKLEPPQS
jgi:hypothetical protein